MCTQEGSELKYTHADVFKMEEEEKSMVCDDETIPK